MGGWILRAISLQDLIKTAWDINSDDLIAGLPKFTESARFDVVAKASTDPKLASQVDDDTLRCWTAKRRAADRPVQTEDAPGRPAGFRVHAFRGEAEAAEGRSFRVEPSASEGPGARDGKDPRVAADSGAEPVC